MVKKRFTYRPALAVFLAALTFQVVVLKEAHHLLAHHHEAAAHCISDGEAHLHSDEYAPLDCQICFFNFAPANFESPNFTLQPPVTAFSESRFGYQPTPATRTLPQFHLRGPPCLPS